MLDTQSITGKGSCYHHDDSSLKILEYNWAACFINLEKSAQIFISWNRIILGEGKNVVYHQVYTEYYVPIPKSYLMDALKNEIYNKMMFSMFF